MTERQIFKITVFAHDGPLYNKLHDVFGIEFESSYTSTSGASFAYAHFDTKEHRLTGQFWMLDPSPQWSSIRNLYIKGASGIVLLLDPAIRNAEDINRRVLREFLSVNRFPVPILIFNVNKNKISKTNEFAKDLERWAGYSIPALSIWEDNTQELVQFMDRVKDWRARNVIYQTLNIYFKMDAINNTSKNVKTIVKQLRKIYTSRYYNLLSDKELLEIILEAAEREGFQHDEETIIYERENRENPWSHTSLNYHNQMKKPKIEKLE